MLPTLLNPSSEKLIIASELDKYNRLFRTFWDCGGFAFKDTGATTWIEHNEWGLSFCFNPTYYAKLTKSQRIFLCAHQLMHIILEHPSRTVFAEDKVNAKLATDIVVNHYLCDILKFNRFAIEGWEDLQWVDTVFPEQDIPTNESWEYYYQLLTQKEKEPEANKSEDSKLKDEGASNATPVQPQPIDSTNTNVAIPQDDHTWWENSEVVECVAREVENIMGTADPDVITALLKTGSKELQTAGWAKGSMSALTLKKVKVKRKWETVIKKWEKKVISSKIQEEERWDRINRRFHNMLSGRDCFLPTEVERDIKQFKEDKIEVYFFLDTSGSCFYLKDRFFNAARTLNPKFFDVRLFSFDTAVEEVSLKSGKVYGGGGTAFNIIEEKIQQLQKGKKAKYPIVWLITDGWGNYVYPAQPKRWHWFLTESHSTEYVHSDSKTFLLSEFE